MKKLYPLTALLLSGIFLAGCSGQKNSSVVPWKGIQAGMEDLSSITDRVEYYDITVESEPIFQWGQKKEDSPMAKKNNALIDMQFYQGEPVQFWTVRTIKGESIVCDLYLYRSDGNREILLQEVVPPQGCYLDQKGNLYLWRKSGKTTYPDGGTETTDPFLRKYDPSGKLLYEQRYDYGYDIEEVRQTENGKMYLNIRGNAIEDADSRRLAELDPATGLIKELGIDQLADSDVNSLYLGTYGDKLAACKFRFLSSNEITEINVKRRTESCFFSFQGTSYIPPTGFGVQDFRILEDGSVEILWASGSGNESIREKLRMEKLEKTPIVLRGLDTEGLVAQINTFNQNSETYYVVVEDCGTGNDREDFARLTSVQIASGKGPDILYGRLMQDYISGMMEKGLLEDFSPYLEKSGLREEDYFPFTFGTWRDGDKLYGITPALLGLDGYIMDSTVLGGTEAPDIETLVDALLRYARQPGHENAVFLERRDSQGLLEFFLKGSDTLWGMVDWEKGSCDFSGELFAKILETAKRYGNNGDRGAVSYIAEGRSSIIYMFEDRAEREKDGKVICGVLFDDGCHAAVTSNSTLAVNANSPNKEGAWEFISFLLGDEAQTASIYRPVSRTAYGAWVERKKESFAGGKEFHATVVEHLANGSTVTTTVMYTAADVTEEIIEEYTEMLEDARPYPLRTVPILDIIKEEAADYFNGSKSAAEVARLVANRVQTYLDEGH